MRRGVIVRVCVCGVRAGERESYKERLWVISSYVRVSVCVSVCECLGVSIWMRLCDCSSVSEGENKHRWVLAWVCAFVGVDVCCVGGCVRLLVCVLCGWVCAFVPTNGCDRYVKEWTREKAIVNVCVQVLNRMKRERTKSSLLWPWVETAFLNYTPIS